LDRALAPASGDRDARFGPDSFQSAPAATRRMISDVPCPSAPLRTSRQRRPCGNSAE
jgi:hypothetical protein